MMTIDKLIQIIAYSLSANFNSYTMLIMHHEYGLRSHDSVSMSRPPVRPISTWQMKLDGAAERTSMDSA